VFDTDLFLYAAENFELDDVLVPVPFIPAFGNVFVGAGYHFVIDTKGAYMCYHFFLVSIYSSMASLVVIQFLFIFTAAILPFLANNDKYS